MPLSATDQQYTSIEAIRWASIEAQIRRRELVEEIDSFLRRYEEQQRREQQRRDEERRDEDKRFWNEEAIPVLRARLSPAEQRVLVELLALLDR